MAKFEAPIIKAMSTLYRIACVPTQKPYRIGLLFTKGSLISARFLQRSNAAPLRLKVNRHVSDRFSYHSLASCEQVPDRSGSQ